MNNLITSQELLKSLNSSTLIEFSAIRFILDIGEPEDYKFTYSLCCYILIKELDKPIKVTSIESESSYTIFAESISEIEYKDRFKNLSENMFFEAFEKYRGIKIENYSETICDNDVLGLCLRFDNNLELHIVSGEHYKTDNGFSVDGPDEMLLIFENSADVDYYGLLKAT